MFKLAGSVELLSFPSSVLYITLSSCSFSWVSSSFFELSLLPAEHGFTLARLGVNRLCFLGVIFCVWVSLKGFAILHSIELKAVTP